MIAGRRSFKTRLDSTRLQPDRTDFASFSALVKQGTHQSIGQPVLVLLGRPPTLGYEHAVHISSSKHPKEIARGLVGKTRAKPS